MSSIFSDDCESISWEEVSQFDTVFGMKAATSLAIPRCWTPPFAIISSAFLQDQKSGDTKFSPEFVARIKSLAGSSSEIIVRSSVVGESIWDRGTYDSVKVNCAQATFEKDLWTAVQQVCSSANGKDVGLMIQRFVRPVTQGHFGNLQRVSKTRDQWEISSLEPDGSTRLTRLNSQRDSAYNPAEELGVKAGVSAERFFGKVGAYLNNELLLGNPMRLNCEWITDNLNYYIVQIDQEDEDALGKNPFQVCILPSLQPKGEKGELFQVADEGALQVWDKLKVLSDLWEPTSSHKPTLFFVELDKLNLLEMDEVLRKLEADFFRLIGPSGIIVRTSVAAGCVKVVNLPRTEGLTAKEAATWCWETCQRLSTEASSSKLAFIAHRFIASRASAWVRAIPGAPTIEINANWGLPDALQFCPFDIWEVHLPTGVATEHPSYKPEMMISRADGGWEYVRVKNDLARRNCITSSEAKEIARRSIEIANKLNQPCHIMWFIGCLTYEGQQFSIPWYWTKAHDSERNSDRSAYKIFKITDADTLAEFEGLNEKPAKLAIALQPMDLDLMRDNNFLEQVAVASKAANVPIILSGSTLGHAYYQLRKNGCSIVTPSEKDHSRIRKTANLGKLVRDKIPARIANRSEVEITREVPKNLVRNFLIGKLLEEGIEVREAGSTEEKTEELADLFEVFRALASVDGISLDSVEKFADFKRKKVGGFEKGLVLLQTGIVANLQSQAHDLNRSFNEVLADRTAYDVAEIPFSFFGFMELDRPKSIYFEEFGIRIEVSLHSDHLRFRVIKQSVQMGLPF